MNTIPYPSFAPLFGLGTLLSLVLTIGYRLQKQGNGAARKMATVLTFLGVALAYAIAKDEHPIVLMAALVLALLYGLKTLVAISDKAKLAPRPWLAFAVGWFGMRPNVFRKLGHNPLDGYMRLITTGLRDIGIGLAFIAAAWALAHYPQFGSLPVVASAMIGLSLILHFGIFKVLAGLWRLNGVPVHALFKTPFKALTLADFWGHRWNTAFVEMTANLIYRPLKKTFGHASARASVFLFSGIAHELAISVPVKSGYGFPTLYFALQALGLELEKRRKLQGRTWTVAWVLLPLPILFHREFIDKIILPIVGAK